MKTLALILIFVSLSLGQDTNKVYLQTRAGGQMLAVPRAWLSGENFQPQATATVDSAIFITKTSLDSVKSNLRSENKRGYWIQRRISDTTNSVATPVNVGNLSFNVTAGTYYQYRYLLVYSTGATTTGIKVSLTYPNVTIASAGVSIFGQAADGATTETWNGTINSSGDVVTSTAVAVQNQPYIAKIEGIILPSADGTVMLKWSPEVAAAATLKQGSSLMYWSY